MSFARGSSVKILDLPTLNLESVHIKDPARVEKILNQLISGGYEKLQIITDFDRTLTLPEVNGKTCLSSFGIFHTCARMPIDYIRQADDLFHFYRPLEINPNICIEEKAMLMEEWTRREADLLDFELNKEDIAEAVARADVELREGTDLMLNRLRDRNVPVLVFSAGLGDTVLGVLEHKQVMHSNMHIISNYLKFEGNRLCGLQGAIIHTFNKNEHAIVNTPYFSTPLFQSTPAELAYFPLPELKDKENVILLGDMVGDAGMSEGVPNINCVLKIGFLEHKIPDYLPSFMEAFDIVLIRDPTMNLVNEILDKFMC